jgi:hypothetical protein
MKLVKSRFQVAGNRYCVPRVLTLLGVAFKKKPCSNFWLTNESDLEYIFNDFAKAKRAYIARHRPDQEDNDTFAQLNISFDACERAFLKHIRSPGDAMALVEQNKRRAIFVNFQIAPDGSAITKRRLLTPEERLRRRNARSAKYWRKHGASTNAAIKKRRATDPKYRLHCRRRDRAAARRRQSRQLAKAA